MDFDTFLVYVFVLVLFGIVKDIVVLLKWFESWIRSKQNGDPRRPASVEVMVGLLREQTEIINDSRNSEFSKHFDSLMEENRKTNDLLRRFLIGQKIIAKNVHKIDLEV